MANQSLLYLASSVVGVLLPVFVVASCGKGHDDDSPPRVEPDPTSEPDGGDADVLPLPNADDCETLGEVVECTVYLPEVGGVTSCFKGQQVCASQDDGSAEWSECTDPETVAQILDEMEAAGELD